MVSFIHVYRKIHKHYFKKNQLIWLLNFYYLLQKLFISVEYICLSCDATSILTFVVTWKIITVHQWNIIIGLFNHKIYYQVVDIASFKVCGLNIVFGRLSLEKKYWNVFTIRQTSFGVGRRMNYIAFLSRRSQFLSHWSEKLHQFLFMTF